MSEKETIFNSFIAKNPDYLNQIRSILSEFERKKIKIDDIDIMDDTLTYTLLGRLDNYFYDRRKITPDIYKELRQLIYKLAEFNYFKYYNEKLLKVNLPDDTQTLTNLEEEI